MTISVEALRGFDFASMNLDQLAIYLAGATENHVGPFADEIAELGFPDLAPVGAGSPVIRP